MLLLAGIAVLVMAPTLQDERYNHRFVLAGGRSVSYSVAGNPDGLPVFLFLVRRYAKPLTDDEPTVRQTGGPRRIIVIV